MMAREMRPILRRKLRSKEGLRQVKWKDLEAVCGQALSADTRGLISLPA
jgi:hypothetical protein